MPEETKEAQKQCQVCQGAIDPSTGACTVCGVKDSAEGPGAPSEIKTDDDALTQWLKGDMNSINKWIEDDAKKTAQQQAPAQGGNEGVQAGPAPQAGVQDVNILKKWLKGEDEGSIEEWIGSQEAQSQVQVPDDIFKPLPASPQAQQKAPEVSAASQVELVAKDEEIERLKAELEESRKILNEQIEKMKADNPDIGNAAAENVELRQRLASQEAAQAKMDAEYNELKKGLATVVKYVKSRPRAAGDGASAVAAAGASGGPASAELVRAVKERDEKINSLHRQLEDALKGLPPESQDARKKELEMLDKEKELQAKIDEFKIKEQAFLERQRSAVTSGGGQAADVIKSMQAEVSDREREIGKLQKTLSQRDDDLRDLRNEIKTKDDEILKLRQNLKFKEDEFTRRDEDLRYREEKLSKEARKIQEASKKIGTMSQQEMEKRLEELQREISNKEAEVKAREKYLSAKTRELELKARGLIETELDMTKEERKAELQEQKVKTGTARLDDLMFGGMPLASNILVYGPPFIGKEILLNTFAAEGLKKGVPVVWVLTSKTIKTIREEMQFIIPNYLDYERVGLVKYVDIYSRTIGETSMDPGVIYIDQPTDTAAITDSVDAIAKELQKRRHEYYRLVFQTISTIMVRLDPGTTFKFLSPFCGKRKRDKGVCLYTIEQGMHTDSDISMIGSMMEGEMDFKMEHEKSFLQVKGVCDVQSRDWIEYTWSKRGLNIKSFSLKLIK